MVLSWFASKLSPIAVDIGTDTIKLLQVEPREGQFRLAAAASEVIPEEVRKTSDREAFIAALADVPPKPAEMERILAANRGSNMETMA